MSRSISNINEMRVEPSELRELISLSPAMEPKDCSSGVATLEAMVSGLAPAMLADTEIMGKSTWGKGATGRKIKASPPDNTMARHSNVVATGRMMKTENSLMGWPRHRQDAGCERYGHAAPGGRTADKSQGR